MVQTHEHDPPPSPIVTVVTRTPDAIELAWTPQEENKDAIEGYVARFRLHEGMDWNEVSLGPDKRGYLFEGLVCGSAYYFSILSYNRNGRSEPGELLQVKTEGTVPQPPSHRTGIVPNVTGLSLALGAWRDGGCPISHFFIQYKSRDDSEWTLLSSRVLPDRDSVAI
ncbi:titin, putative, partial [Ixodes scapularis]